jgi:cell division protein FtsA
VRNGGIEATQSFALGGRTFTRRLAAEQDLEMEEAEALKLRYARGELPAAAAATVKQALDRDVTTWMDGVQLILEELAGEGQLPPHVHLCGGAGALPDILERLQAFPWTERLPCPRPPRIALIQPADVDSVQDDSGELVDQQDVTPMGLALQALALQRQSSLVNQALVRAARLLKL